jgi:hypothetical protein
MASAKTFLEIRRELAGRRSVMRHAFQQLQLKNVYQVLFE